MSVCQPGTLEPHPSVVLHPAALVFMAKSMAFAPNTGLLGGGRHGHLPERSSHGARSATPPQEVYPCSHKRSKWETVEVCYTTVESRPHQAQAG